jgi:hypothetical protein
MNQHQQQIERAEMLHDIQRGSFQYFLREVNETNGLVADKTTPDWPASIAAVGMALTAYPIGVERRFMTREHALQRTLTTLRFFMSSEQGDSPTATGNHGFYYHFLDMQTGRRTWDCELSSIDTALLIAGVLVAAEYFDGAADDEREVRETAAALYERVDWQWMQNGKATVCHGWKPEGGFLQWHWQGYDEAMILYVLGLGSPTHPLPAESWTAWLANCSWQTVEGIEYLHAGPLFIHQMSHVWLDFRGIRDAYMGSHDSDYFENSAKAAHVQQRYAIRNPNQMQMYGEYSWGITASDGPGATKRGQRVGGRTYYDYISRGVPFGPDDGTLAPWAVVASLPFAPDIVLPTIENFRNLQLHTGNDYGFKASFNATIPSDRHHPCGWVSNYHFGINEGPTVMMIENHLTGLIWRLTKKCAPLVQGLRRAGFEGGWLAAPPA